MKTDITAQQHHPREKWRGENKKHGIKKNYSIRVSLILLALPKRLHKLCEISQLATVYIPDIEEQSSGLANIIGRKIPFL